MVVKCGWSFLLDIESRIKFGNPCFRFDHVWGSTHFRFVRVKSCDDSQVWAWLRPGTYPEIVDVKGNVPAGSLIGGSPSDFKNVGE